MTPQEREAMEMALDALEHLQTDIEWQYKSPTRAMLRKVEKAIRAALANEFNPDWDQVEALQESLREHMAEIQRLRAALAQPEQKAQFEFQNYGWWRDEQGKLQLGTLPQRECAGTVHDRREWQGLTDEEIERLFVWQEWSEDFADYEPVARAIEAKLREKNA